MKKLSLLQIFILALLSGGVLLMIGAVSGAFLTGDAEEASYSMNATYEAGAEKFRDFWLGTPSATPSPEPQATWFVGNHLMTSEDYEWPQILHTNYYPWYDLCNDQLFVIRLFSTNTTSVVVELGFNGETKMETFSAPSTFETMCHHIIIQEDPSSNWLLVVSRR